MEWILKISLGMCSDVLTYPCEFMSTTLSITSDSRKSVQTSQKSTEWQVGNWSGFQGNNRNAGSSYNQLLSESDLLNCGWLVVEGIPHWKDGFGLCLGVAKSGFNCLFNVLKTMSFYFHLIKTVKLSFKYMEFATNYHWFCSFLFCSFRF